MDTVTDFIHLNRDRYVDELKQYLAIPSISALPEHAGDVRQCAEWTAAEMGRVGLEHVRLVETARQPGGLRRLAARGRGADHPLLRPLRRAAGRSAGAVGVAAVRGHGARGRDLRARRRRRQGAGVHALQGRGGLPAADRKLPVNIRFILEGEEEIGSVNLDEFVREHKDELAADVVVISDSPMFDRGVPSICYGLRGLTYLQIDLRGSRSDLHSGSFGGAVANPAFVLAQVLGQMKDRSGRVRVPGFYDDVRPLRDEERAEFARLPFNERRYRNELGAPKLFGERGYTTLERLWGRPTFDVNGPAVRVHRRRRQDGHPGGRDGQGEHAPRAGPGSGHDCRSVRGASPQGDAAHRRAERHADARRQALDDRLRQPVRAGGGARHRAGLRPPAGVQREGGSIPVVATFQEVLGLPSVLFGVGLPDENAHAPNEKLDLGNFHSGIIASAALYDEIGAC